ncbi:MAG: hypothetical protein K1X54_06805 [Flavobacteriales bacterium]|nr:hypothetical protein [Flavobacteriales bacterium]
MKKGILHITLFCLVLISCNGCKDKGNYNVPYVPVNITININQPDFFNLTVPTGWVYITGGSRGIIVYRKSESEFVAIERHSTYQPEDQCAVTVAGDGVLIDDPCSDSQWLIMDGTLVNGPASTPLVTYDATFNSPYLTIVN